MHEQYLPISSICTMHTNQCSIKAPILPQYQKLVFVQREKLPIFKAMSRFKNTQTAIWHPYTTSITLITLER